MISTTESVYRSIKLKRSAKEEAERLGLSLQDYFSIKHRILEALKDISTTVDDYIIDYLHTRDKSLLDERLQVETPATKITSVEENVEAGTRKITGISSLEPKSPEEITEMLHIDTTKWKLAQYWNMQKNGQWVISALVTPVSRQTRTEQSFLERIASIEFPQISPEIISKIHVQKEASEVVCGVLSLQDIHFGKIGNDDIAQDVQDAVDYLCSKAYYNYHVNKLVLVIGPDLLNMDTFAGATTKGTPVDNCESAVEAYLKAFDSVCKTVVTMSRFCEELEVVFIPGNHDRLSSFHLLHAVAQSFKGWSNITFNVNYSERKVMTFGENMFCFEHGDVTSKNNPLVYAVEFPEEWGNTKHRTLFTGHYHGRRTKEMITENEQNGFRSKILPALTTTDYYHYHNKYVGNKRSATLEVHERSKGLLSEFTYTA